MREVYIDLSSDNYLQQPSIFGGYIWLYPDDGIYVKGVKLTSDKNQKNSITSIDNRYNTLFDNLSPVAFKYNNDKDDLYHTGFIAQEVYDAMVKANLEKEFSVVNILKNNEKENWYLSYIEFIALNTYQIQNLKKEIVKLKELISGNFS